MKKTLTRILLLVLSEDGLKERILSALLLVAMISTVALSGGGYDIDLHGSKRLQKQLDLKVTDASEKLRREPLEYVVVREGGSGTSWLLGTRTGTATPFGEESAGRLLDLAARYKTPVSSLETVLKCAPKLRHQALKLASLPQRGLRAVIACITSQT